MNYAEASARRRGWTVMTEQWSRLADQRGIAPAEPQADLFDAVRAPMPEAGLAERAMPKGPRGLSPLAPTAETNAQASWIPTIREGWV